MTLVKTSLLSAISTVIKVISGFISVKIVAIYLGPSGLALLGQMQNFIGLISSIASAGVGSGVVKYTAEYYDNNEIKKRIWGNAIKVSLLFIFPLLITIMIFSKDISEKLLGSAEYSSIFIILALTLIFFSFNILLTSILNGQKEIKKLVLINIISSLVSLLITIYMVVNYKLYGALISGIISQAIVFLITLSFVIRSSWFKISMFIHDIDKETIKNLSKYSLMALVSAIGVPLTQIYLRDYIGNSLGWDEAGYWQAIWRISETYLMLVTTTLSIYYLPKLSGIKDARELKQEIFYVYKVVMPIVIIMAIIIFIFKGMIIKILFSNEFMPMLNLFLFQLMGDVVKIASWILGFIMVAKAMTKLFVFTEIFFKLTFIAMSILFIQRYGLIGVTVAFFVNYILYYMFLYYSLRGYINGK